MTSQNALSSCNLKLSSCRRVSELYFHSDIYPVCDAKPHCTIILHNLGQSFFNLEITGFSKVNVGCFRSVQSLLGEILNSKKGRSE